MPLTQNRHPLTLAGPLGTALVVRSVRGREALSEPFVYEVEMECDDQAADFATVVGKGMAVGIARTGAGPRWIHGVVARFSHAAGGRRTAGYRAELRPWLWLLTLRADCRIFQRKSVPEILETLFQGHAVRNALTGSYDKREFCVQYRETDFDFASRLMEEEGISYFWEHTKDAHTLVLADDADGYPPCAELKAAVYREEFSERDVEDAVDACALERGMGTGMVVLSDYSFETPTTSLKADSGEGKFPVYDYPGGYTVRDAGERRARLRAEAFDAGTLLLTGTSTCRAFVPGHRFTLQGHPRSDANAEYVLRALTVHADQDGYANGFEAIPAATPIRPARRTPRPAIAGTQTAVVVGKSGEEIWTDKYGRVKVQFHWDREGKNDENSSCWVRVSQGWAGTGWGSWILPRVGQEVVVTFLDGDPDRPLVTGCVFNAARTLPYALPANQTRSTFRSSSSPGGAAFNEIRLEDKKDVEEMYLHAGRDLTVEVVRNRTVTITGGDDALAVKKGKRGVQVEGDESLEVKGKRAVTVTGDETHTGKAKFTQTTGGDYVLEVSGNLTLKASGSITIQSGTGLTLQAGTALTARGGTSAAVEAGTTLTARGNASTELSSTGITTVKGSLVKLNG
jgi:type VI secretion system secreted protein VgrG